jgi:hypothetical protein
MITCTVRNSASRAYVIVLILSFPSLTRCLIFRPKNNNGDTPSTPFFRVARHDGTAIRRDADCEYNARKKISSPSVLPIYQKAAMIHSASLLVH